MHYLYYHTTTTPCAQYLSITPLSHCIHQTVQRYTPYHNICFNALFHFLHFSSLPIYLFISNIHSSIPRCNNLSFINYTFIYAHKNWWKWVKRKINRYSLLFIGHKRLFESRSVGRLWGHVLPPSRESLVEFLAGERNLTSILTSSLLRDLPDQYLYRRNTRNRSSHLPKARPVSSLSEVTRPLFFFSSSSFLCRRTRLLASKGKIPCPSSVN